VMRRLTQREIEIREVKAIIKKINILKDKYGLNLTRRACNQFYLKTGEKLKLEKEIRLAEQQLVKMKKLQ